MEEETAVGSSRMSLPSTMPSLMAVAVPQRRMPLAVCQMSTVTTDPLSVKTPTAA